MTRHEEREQAFLLLFEWSFREDETVEELVELALRCRCGEGEKIGSFAKKLAETTVSYILQINDVIERYSDKWKINRLSRVTLAVLRIGICEIDYMEDIPPGVTINEAVELMKQYATEDEASYVNGVLGAYNRAKEAAGDDADAEAAGGTSLSGEEPGDD